ncbi:PKD domain-containing protein [Candidatus Gracilibacteria bacterium]|nr:PKD domain-containing protein [Candidatus Gracilibacteria bacterium]
MKKILYIFLFWILTFVPGFTATPLVEDIFSDISADYEYRDELQALYDRGMIIPDGSSRFNPQTFLNRDEFVGISMEVICERCIAPHTDYELIQEFTGKDVYFDINASNPYFYCVAEADKQNYVRGYDISQSCENGTTRFGERPFCPSNRINLEEAVAVLLRNSGIFTINDNQVVIESILNGTTTETLGSDVRAKDSAGNPYTFYGYIRKAMTYEITEYDTSGNEKVLKLLETDAQGNINPKQSITKEQFLRMSYIALKSNSCNEVTQDEFALALDIFEKTCTPGQVDCKLSDLKDPSNTYDFHADAQGSCESGITKPSGYVWRFIHQSTGQETFKYGEFIDNFEFQDSGEWRIILRVTDTCGQSSEVFSTIFVPESSTETVSQQIDVDIDVFDDNCTLGNNTCKKIDFTSGEDDGDNIFDFAGKVDTSCKIGIITYNWTYTHSASQTERKSNGVYQDNKVFDIDGLWNITLEVRDGCGNTGSEQMSYTVYPETTKNYIDADIDVFDDGCIGIDANCQEISFSSDETDGDNIFDFAGNVDTSCKVGNISYNWKFQLQGTSQVISRQGRYVDNFSFLDAGVWKISLEVRDGCGQSAREEMTYIVPKVQKIDVSIDVFDDTCSGVNANCTPIDFTSGETNGNNIFDFAGKVDTSCNIGVTKYNWTFEHLESGTKTLATGLFQDNRAFPLDGLWSIQLDVIDGCGNTGSETMNYTVYPTKQVTYIDLDIDVFDDTCTPKDTNCKEIYFSNQEDNGNNIFDFLGEVDTSCKVGTIKYNWKFNREGTTQSIQAQGRYVDNFSFLESGVWNIELVVADGCGQTATEQMTYIVTDTSATEGLSVDIDATPIYGYEDLLVNFNARISGGQGPYTYEWSFGDSSTPFYASNIDHLYQSSGTYNVLLVVTDSLGKTASATVIIQVLDGEACLQDSDGDGIGNCEDMCPLIAGTANNLGCPILETQCQNTNQCPSAYSCENISPDTGYGACIPTFNPARTCLYNPDIGSIFGNAICTTCPCSASVDFLADVRKCDLIFPAITSADGSEIYSRGEYWQISE